MGPWSTGECWLNSLGGFHKAYSWLPEPAEGLLTLQQFCFRTFFFGKWYFHCMPSWCIFCSWKTSVWCQIELSYGINSIIFGYVLLVWFFSPSAKIVKFLKMSPTPSPMNSSRICDCVNILHCTNCSRKTQGRSLLYSLLWVYVRWFPPVCGL